MVKDWYQMSWQEQIKEKQRQNKSLLNKRVKLYNQKKGIRIGDWIKEKNGNMTRVTHIWADGQIQTGGEGGSFYLGNGYISYSGGLDSGYNIKKLKKTDKKKMGSVWLFDKDFAGAGRGVNFKIKFKVYEVK